ncbi:MAG TPA: DegV family protein [Solirubrobacteraceae bacterium]|jgi:DegV family protein with EDD domain|nr:DegV family protein [Solirubrobacteraceae bacterium]
MPVTVVTDSTHYAPRALLDEFAVRQVSLYVGWGDDRVRELELGGFDDFYTRLRTDPELPTTSQPSIGDYLEVWEPLLEQGHDIASVHLAGGISGTTGAARQAKELLDERGHLGRVEVIDGETGCGGLGFIALAGGFKAREGADLDAVVQHILDARRSVKIWFCIDTLEYLQRGGRVGKAQAWIGGALKIKPILSLEYEITPVERVRTAGRAFDRMVHYLRERHRDGATLWVIQHIQAPDVAQRLREAGLEIYGYEPLFLSEVGPVIGTYTGPGMIGVGGADGRYVGQTAG